MTLTRQATLTGPRDFSFVFAKAKKVYGPHLTVLVRPTDRAHPRLGLAISKKHTKTAICRNLVRRIVKESFRHNAGHLGGLDIVVLSKRGVAQVDRRELRQSIDRQWLDVIKKCATS
ncbi:MAG: ribonuclease P protein component [Pseudomonadota bacterium]